MLRPVSFVQKPAKKSIRDQIIEGLNDGDTIEDLLQESGLTLTATITKCQSREAAKKHRTDITTQDAGTVAALRKPQDMVPQAKHCPGCGGAHHKGGRSQCPAFNHTCSFCHKVGHFARVCRGKKTRPTTTANTAQVSANAIRVQPHPKLCTTESVSLERHSVNTCTCFVASTLASPERLRYASHCALHASKSVPLLM